MRKLFPVGIAIGALAFALVACTPQDPGPTSTPSAVETVAPQPSPTPSAVAKAEFISVTSTRIDILDHENTVIQSLPVTSAPTAVVAAFTALFGKPPVKGTFTASEDSAGGATYSWDGFTVRVADGRMFSGDTIHFSVASTTAKSGDLRIEFDGLAVGDSIAKLRSVGGKLVSTYNGDSGNGGHDGDVWAFGSTSGGGLTLEVIARIKSSAVGSLSAPSDANGS